MADTIITDRGDGSSSAANAVLIVLAALLVAFFVWYMTTRAPAPADDGINVNVGGDTVPSPLPPASGGTGGANY